MGSPQIFSTLAILVSLGAASLATPVGVFDDWALFKTGPLTTLAPVADVQFSESSGRYTVNAAGTRILGIGKVGQLKGEMYTAAWKRVSIFDDWEMTARVILPAGLPTKSEVGLLARQQPDGGFSTDGIGWGLTVKTEVKNGAGIRTINVLGRAQLGGATQVRQVYSSLAGGPTFLVGPQQAMTVWLKLKRYGLYFAVYVSADGITWSEDLAARWGNKEHWAGEPEWRPSIEADCIPEPALRYHGGDQFVKVAQAYLRVIGATVSGTPTLPIKLADALHVGIVAASGNGATMPSVVFDSVSWQPSASTALPAPRGLNLRVVEVNGAHEAVGDPTDLITSSVDIAATIRNAKDYSAPERFPSVPSRNTRFLARWAGSIKPKKTGAHLFEILTTGGVRLWIADPIAASGVATPANWRSLIADWNTIRPPTVVSSQESITLEVGKEYPIWVEYYHDISAKSPVPTCSLRWRLTDSSGTISGVAERPAELVPPNCLRPHPNVAFQKDYFSLKVAGVTDRSVGLVWDGSASVDPKLAFDVSQNNVKVATTVNPSFTLPGLSSDAPFSFQVKDILQHQDTSAARTEKTRPLPIGWNLRSVGRTRALPGVNYREGNLVISSAGLGLRKNKPDAFGYLHRSVTAWSPGEGAEFEFVSLANENHPTAVTGIMLRDSVRPTSHFVFLGFQPREGVVLATRNKNGTLKSVLVSGKTKPRLGDRLKLEVQTVGGEKKIVPSWLLQGNSNGWTSDAKRHLPLNDYLSEKGLVGVAAFSGDYDEPVTAVLRDPAGLLLSLAPSVKLVAPSSGRVLQPNEQFALSAEIDGLSNSRFASTFRVERLDDLGAVLDTSVLQGTAATSLSTVGQYRIFAQARLQDRILGESAPVNLFVTSWDADLDGLPDEKEQGYFGGSTIYGRDDDADGDGLLNWQEFEAGTSPVEFNLSRALDSDADGLLDQLETTHFQGLTRDGSLDKDLDGLSDARELARGTDPNRLSTDGDQLDDGEDPQPLIPSSVAEVVWLDDALPASAIPETIGEGWIWAQANPEPVSGLNHHLSKASGGVSLVHEHGFQLQGLPHSEWQLDPADRLTFYFCPFAVSRPTHVVVSYSMVVGGLVSQRYIYLGPAISIQAIPPEMIPTGSSAVKMAGAIPKSGIWHRVAVLAGDLGLPSRATVTGIRFRCMGGGGAWDRIGKEVPPHVHPPLLTPAGGAFSSPVSVTLSSQDSVANIHYTLDGTVPTIASSFVKSGGAVRVTTTTNVRAIAVKGQTSSVEAGAGFTISDLDGDGLNDSYERAHGLDPMVDDKILDSDGDGIFNPEDARPFDATVGRVGISIRHPTAGASLQ